MNRVSKVTIISNDRVILCFCDKHPNLAPGPFSSIFVMLRLVVKHCLNSLTVFQHSDPFSL